MPIVDLNKKKLSFYYSLEDMLENFFFDFRFSSEIKSYNICIKYSKRIKISLEEKNVFSSKKIHILGNITFSSEEEKVIFIILHNLSMRNNEYEDFILNNGFALERAIKKESGHLDFTVEMNWL
jgi:hypothetical protein